MNTELKESGEQLIIQERERQISKEGWTAEHDDQHIYGELAKAADCYYEYADDNDYTDTKAHQYWPWDKSWWKPKDQLRDYIRAGALYRAEKERLERTGGAVGQKLTNLRIGIRQCEIKIDEILAHEAYCKQKVGRTTSPPSEIKTAEEILRQHLHGFSDEQFEKEISHFPLCEVPFAMERYHNQFAVDGWISVEDRLPEDESDLYKNDGFTESSAMVLVLTDCESIINNSRVKMAVGEKQWTWVMNIHEEQITHWTRCLPLPSPPQNTKES